MELEKLKRERDERVRRKEEKRRELKIRKRAEREAREAKEREERERKEREEREEREREEQEQKEREEREARERAQGVVGKWKRRDGEGQVTAAMVTLNVRAATPEGLVIWKKPCASCAKLSKECGVTPYVFFAFC